MRPDLVKIKAEQEDLAKRVLLIDKVEKPQLIGAIDHSYIDNTIITCAVVMDFKTNEVIEEQRNIEEVTFPYIPGFLSYREAPSAIKVFNKLENKPDLLIIDGNGVLHPRKMGIACHVGLYLDVPTIGIAKNLLCGTVLEDTIYLGKEAVGKIIKTKEKAKPIYVSPGHNISLKTTIELVRENLKGHKLPESLHMAHKQTIKEKKKLQSDTIEE